MFNRSQESQPSDIKKDDRANTDTKDPGSKALPTLPANGENGHFITNGSVTDKELPAMPDLESQPTGEAAAVPRDPRRASMPLPPIASPSMLAGRFYSQAPTDTPSSAQHTRVKSQPFMTAPPLSPVAPSDSNRSTSQSSDLHTSEGRDSQELPADATRHSREPEESSDAFESQDNHQDENQAQSALGPSLSVKSRKRAGDQSESANTAETIVPKNIAVSSDSTFANHPHRDSEARTLNESKDPVELALTKDDSSEEIVMSPTTYPGQEWTPMHY